MRISCSHLPRTTVPGGFRLQAALLIITLLVITLPLTVARASDAPIRLNTLGFLPDHDKRASIAAPCREFSVIDEASGTAAFRGHTSGPVRNADTSEDLYVADFSALKRPGLYHLEVAGVGRSASFRISNQIYNFALYTAVRAMTLWRCGTAVRGTHNGM